MSATSAQAQAPREAPPSACETMCRSQQEALAACVTAIRYAGEAAPGAENEDETSSDVIETACLAPRIAAWTECCSNANNGGVEVNQGHIGI